ncbi:hypothetical protein JCM11672_19270 [Alkaliphilus crotonatoxidans]
MDRFNEIKGFEIRGCVSVPEAVTYGMFYNQFIEFIESNKWLFDGGINEIVDGFYINSDGTRGKTCF